MYNGFGEVEDYYIPFAEPLPLNLLNFDAIKKGNLVQLNWSTSLTHNNNDFDIERSSDGINWTDINFVNSNTDNGNSNLKIEYYYTDKAPAKGLNLYRLKQKNIKGKYDYSLVRKVNFDILNNINIYPNPTTDNVKIEGLIGDEKITVYDITGRLVLETKANQSSVSISLGKLANGAYQMNIVSADGTVSSYKIVKK